MNDYDFETFVPGNPGFGMSPNDLCPLGPPRTLKVPEGEIYADWLDHDRSTRTLVLNHKDHCIDFKWMHQTLKAVRHEYGQASVKEVRVLVAQPVLLLEPWSLERLERLGFVRDLSPRNDLLFAYVKRLKVKDEPAQQPMDSEGNEEGAK